MVSRYSFVVFAKRLPGIISIVVDKKNFNNERFIKHISDRFPVISLVDDIYMKKREEFIYLQLGNGDGNYSGCFKEVPQGEIDTKLSSNRVNAAGYAKSCDDWCQYCAVREICLEPYKYGKN